MQSTYLLLAGLGAVAATVYLTEPESAATSAAALLAAQAAKDKLTLSTALAAMKVSNAKRLAAVRVTNATERAHLKTYCAKSADPSCAAIISKVGA
jgi:hypothetical protein